MDATPAAAATKTAPPGDQPVVTALKGAALWTGITFLLTFLVVGLSTVARGGRYEFNQRWDVVGGICATVFFGYLAASYLHWVARRPEVTRFFENTSKAVAKTQPAVRPILLLAVLAYPFVVLIAKGGDVNASRYLIDQGVVVMIYILLGWGLNIVVGLAGLLDLGYVAFYAVGAYTFAILATTFGLSFWECLPIAGLLAAVWGVTLGFPVLRLRGDYLAIVTLAFGEIIRLVLINWRDFSGGASGLNRLPRPTFFGLSFAPSGPNTFAEYFGLEYSVAHRLIFFYYVVLALAAITLLVTIRLRRLPIGRAWEALREDEIACRSLGISVVNTKLTAFALGATFGGLAGAVFAARQEFISPNDFNFLQSALVLAIVVLGGLGSNIGVMLAAIVLVGGTEALRNLDFLTAIFGPSFEPTQYRMLVFGVAMVAIMIWRPRGLVSGRTPTIFLKMRKAIGAGTVNQGRG